jgi:hypothetical protein
VGNAVGGTGAVASQRPYVQLLSTTGNSDQTHAEFVAARGISKTSANGAPGISMRRSVASFGWGLLASSVVVLVAMSQCFV